ncbi:MAG: hypothetical protein HDS11_02615 [Bacteroides sp.]|nr:hypothetical protein [Bacteroides sp.]
MKITKRDFAKAITSMIALKFGLEFNQTWDLFIQSRVYQMIINEDEKIKGLSLDEIEDLWENERLFGQIISSEEVQAGALRYKKLK